MRRIKHILATIIAFIISILILLSVYGVFGVIKTMYRLSKDPNSKKLNHDWGYYMAFMIVNLMTWTIAIYMYVKFM